jgi:hypothetical protein
LGKNGQKRGIQWYVYVMILSVDHERTQVDIHLIGVEDERDGFITYPEAKDLPNERRVVIGWQYESITEIIVSTDCFHRAARLQR